MLEDFFRFWDQLEFDITGCFDDEAQPHNHLLAKELPRFCILKYKIW